MNKFFKHTRVRTILKATVFLAIFVALFLTAQRLLQAQWTTNSAKTTVTWDEYKSLEVDTVDVLFIGTSHAYYGVDPMYLYANSGITAYVLADGGLRFDLIYLSLCEALKTQSPGVVFLDMSAIHYTFCLKEEEAHRTLDNLSLSWEKIAYALNNTCKNLTFWNVLFPFFRYHTRWDSLTSTDFDYLTGNVDASYTRGHYISYTSVAAEYEFYDEAEEDRLTLSDVYGLEYLYRIYELCEKHDIELILYKIPSATWYESNSEVSGEVAAELGLWYWELFYELDEIGLDAETDFVDGIEHLNQTGAEKVTDYLMQYLLENYELTDWRGINTRWDEDLIAYQALLK